MVWEGGRKLLRSGHDRWHGAIAGVLILAMWAVPAAALVINRLDPRMETALGVAYAWALGAALGGLFALCGGLAAWRWRAAVFLGLSALGSFWKFTGGRVFAGEGRPLRDASSLQRHRCAAHSLGRGGATGSSSRRCVQRPSVGEDLQSPWRRRSA